MKRLYRTDSEEIGWISTCDLLLLMLAISMLLLLLAAGRLAVATSSSEVGDLQIAKLEAEARRLRDELGLWTVAAEESQGELRRARETIQSQESQVGSLEKSVQSHLEAERVTEKALADSAARLQGLQSDLAEAQEQAARSAADAERIGADFEAMARQVEDLKRRDAKLEAAQSKIEELERTIASTRDLVSDATERAASAQAEISAAKARIDNDREVRQELLGIPGKLSRVVMVVDRSQSMSDGSRWEDAKRTVAAWIEHLPVESAVLVVFGSNVSVVPARYEPPRDSLRNSADIPSIDESTRAEMLGALNEFDPAGLTPTTKALRQAMKFRDIDAIILFTDGAPETGAGSVVDATTEVFGLVEEWCRENPNGRVHAVGIGNYFERRMRDFLLGVAKRGRGAFIGR